MLLPSVRFKFDTRLLLSGFSHDFSISVDYACGYLVVLSAVAPGYCYGVAVLLPVLSSI